MRNLTAPWWEGHTQKHSVSSIVEDGNRSMGELTGNLRVTRRRRTSERMSRNVARTVQSSRRPLCRVYFSGLVSLYSLH